MWEGEEDWKDVANKSEEGPETKYGGKEEIVKTYIQFRHLKLKHTLYIYA